MRRRWRGCGNFPPVAVRSFFMLAYALCLLRFMVSDNALHALQPLIALGSSFWGLPILLSVPKTTLFP